MRGIVAAVMAVALVSAVAVSLLAPSPPTPSAGPMTLWEAYARGNVTIEQVDITWNPGGGPITAPIGYKVTNRGAVPVIINESAVLMSPHPLQSGNPPQTTTQDGTLTNATIPAGSSVTYSYAELWIQGVLPPPPWWCTEEFQFTQAGVSIALGGEILPFVLQTQIDHPYYTGPAANTQVDLWNFLKSYPTLVVGKTPLWRTLPNTPGQVLDVTVVATNIAVRDDKDQFFGNVDAVGAIVQDVVPAGWTVVPGSYSRAPTSTTDNPGGTKTVKWTVDLPAANVTGRSTPDQKRLPTPYNSVTIRYQLKSPRLPAGRLALPRATVDWNHDGTVDAHSAIPVLDVFRVNSPPVANAGGPYAGVEGSPITFNAGLSSDPDNDSLTYRWDFQNDGTWDTDWSANPLATHMWGDDWTGTARVEVSDGSLTANATANVTVTNVPPAIALTVTPNGNEGQSLIFQAHVTDPGSDDETFTWNGECQGWSAPRIHYNNGVSPDPHPSPDVRPMDVWDNQTIVCGDNGAYGWSLKVVDDDGGVAQARGTFSIANLPPAFTISLPNTTASDEGSLVTLGASATDPGSDDLTFTWDWQYGPTESHIYYNNGVSPDPVQSPNGTFPFSASDSSHFIYGHEGTFTVTLTVMDDDGGFITFTTDVAVANVPPTVFAGPNVTIDEGQTANVAFTFSDPGFDMPNAGLYENFTGTVDWGYAKWPAEPAAVVKIPGGPGVPTIGFVNLSKVYGDNGVFTVTVTVCDDGGGCGTASLLVTVRNVAPTLVDVQAYVVANVTLRVAGEKWHDVRMDLVWNGNVTGSVRVIRMPGSPDRQVGTITGAHLQLLGEFAIILYYTPADDKVNGQPNGANPAWVILTFPDGSEVRLHHTFNVQHEQTWVWTISDLRPFLVGKTITFQGTAHDVGSDDLTFAWSFGDGSPDVSTVYYNNGIGPDPFPSPEVNPITVTDVHDHVFGMAGTYGITLTVTDDDGGSVVVTFDVTVG